MAHFKEKVYFYTPSPFSKWVWILSSLAVLLVSSPVESFAIPQRAGRIRLLVKTSSVTFRGKNFVVYDPTYTLITKPTCLSSSSDDNQNDIQTKPTVYTPLERPVLAVIDTLALIVFAAVGKSSHSPDGSLDVAAVMVTAFPFIASWIVTSPLTGVYSPDERGEEVNLVRSTVVKVGKGWALAVPLGIVLRGVIKGYIPPVSFMVVTLISTLVILGGARILFSVAEDFFVEFVS
mmetsp:Transcript_2029/g.4595  ORF Transcript_2029/g.4595 Transcript_2029/m.4595 type:complete len:234 (-) Transcript_2029:350-1051(-)